MLWQERTRQRINRSVLQLVVVKEWAEVWVVVWVVVWVEVVEWVEVVKEVADIDLKQATLTKDRILIWQDLQT